MCRLGCGTRINHETHDFTDVCLPGCCTAKHEASKVYKGHIYHGLDGDSISAAGYRLMVRFR